MYLASAKLQMKLIIIIFRLDFTSNCFASLEVIFFYFLLILTRDLVQLKEKFEMQVRVRKWTKEYIYLSLLKLKAKNLIKFQSAFYNAS